MTTTPTGRRAPSLLRAGATAVVAAAVLTALTHLLFAALGADFRVTPPGQAPTVVPAAQAALVAALATAVGVGLAALLVRFVPRRAVVVLLVVCAVVLVAFAANPVVAADQVLTVVALEVEHLVVAGVYLALVLPAVRRAVAGRSVAAA